MLTAEAAHLRALRALWLCGRARALRIEDARLCTVSYAYSVKPWCQCRRPRRLGGGKGGESREPRPPKKAGKGVPAGLPGPPASSAAPPPRAALPPPPAAAERPR